MVILNKLNLIHLITILVCFTDSPLSEVHIESESSDEENSFSIINLAEKKDAPCPPPNSLPYPENFFVFHGPGKTLGSLLYRCKVGDCAQSNKTHSTTINSKGNLKKHIKVYYFLWFSWCFCRKFPNNLFLSLSINLNWKLLMNWLNNSIWQNVAAQVHQKEMPKHPSQQKIKSSIS